MKQAITDQETLETCKRLLDTWSATQAYSPTSQLGTDSKLVSAESFTLERFSLETGVRTRRFVLKQLKNGSSYYEHPDSISQYGIWDDVKPEVKREDFEAPIDKTTHAKQCPTCKGEGKSICSKCNGRGEIRCTKHHTSFYANGKHYENMVPVGGQLIFSQRVSYNKEEYYHCDCDPQTHIKKCDCDNGYVTCKTCDGHGELVYEWFLEQKYKAFSQSKTWKPNGNLTDGFCSFDKLPWATLYEREIEDDILPPRVPHDASEETAKVMESIALEETWQAFDAGIKENCEKFKSKGGEGAVLRPSFQSARLEQYDGIVRYAYEYGGKKYVAWINLATSSVEECEEGFYASIAEETVRQAKEAEQNDDPQKSIYYYCKADAISLKWGKENGTQKKRIVQYRKLGLWFGGALLICSMAEWIPALALSGMNLLGLMTSLFGLALITACMVSTNEALQVCGLLLAFGLAYASRQWFGSELADDMVSREGLFLSCVFHALVALTLTTDFAQRLPRGRKGLMFGGLVAGVCAVPLPLYIASQTQSFTSVGGMFLPLTALLVFMFLRLPYRLKAGKMQRFVEKNQGQGEKIKREIEKRQPGRKGLVDTAIVMGCIVVTSVIGMCTGGLVDGLFGDLHFKLISALSDFGIL